jgi:hypothetical protein
MNYWALILLVARKGVKRHVDEDIALLYNASADVLGLEEETQLGTEGASHSRGCRLW